MTRTHQPGQALFQSILPEDIARKPFPAFPPSVRLAVVVGQPSEPGPYVVRVKVPSGVKLMPHKHPEDRVYTVMSGVFYIGLGDTFDADSMKAYPPGSALVLPGDTFHFHWAKSGEYITQVRGIGPLGLEYLNPKDDPRNTSENTLDDHLQDRDLSAAHFFQAGVPAADSLLVKVTICSFSPAIENGTMRSCVCPIGERTMSKDINHDRRRFFATAAMTLAAAQLGMFGSADAQSRKIDPADVPSIKPGTNTSFGPLKQIDAGLLSVGYAEAGPSGGPVVILLHGWPYDIHSYVDVVPLLASQGYRVIVPSLRGYGATRFLSSETFRNGQPSALALDIVALMDALTIEKAILGGFDWGARSANIIAVLWPERCKAMVSVSGYLIGSQASGQMPLPPRAELEWWYQYYFATERGRAGYDKYRHDFAKLIWQIASPQWHFDDATFDRSAAAFNNPDHVAIVIHNYRWRLGLAEGEPKYDNLEKRLAEFPVITVPTMTLEGDANGAPHPGASSYAKKFSGKYSHRTIRGGIGHNLPQEAPQAFAEAIVEVDGY